MIARVAGRAPGAPHQRCGRLDARFRAEPERLEVVVRQHLASVFGPRERLDPPRRSLVPRRTLRARDLAVRNVAHEQVPERELVVALDGGALPATDELLARERVERRLGPFTRALADRADRAAPEDLPEHRGVLEQALL